MTEKAMVTKKTTRTKSDSASKNAKASEGKGKIDKVNGIKRISM